MPPTIGFVLAAAVLHAVWNLAAKRYHGDGSVFVWSYMTLGAVLCLPLALLVLARDPGAWSWRLLIGPLVSALIHIVYSLVLQAGYKRAELTVVYPVARGVGPLLTVVVAVAVLGERPGLPALAGVALVLAGITVVTTLKRQHGGRPLASGLGYGAATGAMIAAYTLWDDHAVTRWDIAPIAYFGIAVTMQAALLTPAAVRRRDAIRPALTRYWREIATVAVLSPAAYLLVLVAMQRLPVTIVAPARESSIVVGSLLAWWLFKEAQPLRRVAGAAVVLTGITLIALA
ncbi:DMT family transporter [Actinocatenispora sera]|uniref:Membrane protein n=1 Tax=Actinocatenispora sera TaxID=390989 RepID=A0A810L2G2_9ACTN|nr:DMT family transporter [Actinocatenispora sera]BCJ28832.1 membrane protein [Actinocatenispora sera]